MTDFELKLQIIENQKNILTVLQDIRWLCAYGNRDKLPKIMLANLGIPTGRASVKRKK